MRSVIDLYWECGIVDRLRHVPYHPTLSVINFVLHCLVYMYFVFLVHWEG